MMNFAEFEYCTIITLYLLNDNRHNKETEYKDLVCFPSNSLDIKKSSVKQRKNTDRQNKNASVIWSFSLYIKRLYIFFKEKLKHLISFSYLS